MRAAVVVLAAALAASGAGAAAAASSAQPPSKHVRKKHAQRKHRKAVRCGSARGNCVRDATLIQSGTPVRGVGSGAGAGATVTTPTVGQVQLATPPATPLGHLQVKAREFSIVLSRQSVAAGLVAVELDNLGEDPHDLRVERTDGTGATFDFEPAKPSTVATRKLDLAAGRWRLYCTLPGHDEAGMHAVVTVTP
ncbi:MAG TPA: hypothetical protein VF545_00335 [Thermoleophilaceae bacterium]